MEGEHQKKRCPHCGEHKLINEIIEHTIICEKEKNGFVFCEDCGQKLSAEEKLSLMCLLLLDSFFYIYSS